MGWLSTVGAVVWGVLDKAIDIPDRLRKAANAISRFKKKFTEWQNGKDLKNDIEKVEEKRQEALVKSKSVDEFKEKTTRILQYNTTFTREITVEETILHDIGRKPGDYGVIHGQLLSEVRDFKYYQTDSVFSTLIIHDSNNDKIMLSLPNHILRYSLTRPHDTPLTINHLDDIGLSSKNIMPEISYWFNMLSKEDQIYFSQLYKDYYELATHIKQKDILSLTQFCQKLYTKREEKLRETGASSMTFDLRAKSNGEKVQRAYIIARPIGKIEDASRIIY